MYRIDGDRIIQPGNIPRNTNKCVLASKAHTNYVMYACYIGFCTVVSQKCTTIFCLLVRKLFMVPQLIFQVKTIVTTAKKE